MALALLLLLHLLHHHPLNLSAMTAAPSLIITVKSVESAPLFALNTLAVIVIQMLLGASSFQSVMIVLYVFVKTV